VVAFHAKVPGTSGGFIGVDVFFVLSGYLITGLLIKEFQSTNRINMWQFYARRARRLLPASASVVIATLLLGPLVLAPQEQMFLARAARATVLYMSNMFFAQNAADYFAANVETNPLLHTWSLAVEEQFYFVWPLLLLLCLRHGRSRKTLFSVISVLSIVSLAGSIWLTKSARNWAFYGSHARAWEFGIGGLATQISLRRLGLPKRLWGGMGWLGILAIAAAGAGFREDMSFPGVIALLPVLGTTLVLMVGAEEPDHLIGRFLDWKALQLFGRLSYSWYLWHWPMLVGAAVVFPALSVGGRIACAVGSLALAATTHQLIENPIRFHRLLVRRPDLTLGLALLLTLITFAFSQHSVFSAKHLASSDSLRLITAAVTDGSSYPDKSCFTEGTSSKVLTCTFGAPKAATSIALFGDSHAAQWFDAIRRIAAKRGWRLMTFLKSGCPATDVVYPHRSLGPEFGVSCSKWRHDAIEQVIAVRPTLVVIGNSTYLSLEGERGGYHVSLEEWREGTRRTLRALSGAGLHIVQLRDNPKATFDVPTCLARAAVHDWYLESACTLKRSKSLPEAIFQVERDAARDLPHVEFIDMSDQYCQGETCQPIQDGVVRYQDNDHLSARFIESLSPAIESRLVKAMAAQGSDSTPLGPSPKSPFP
jgi:peptidoglycan/LPS O-acetylase OafA/YrhL